MEKNQHNNTKVQPDEQSTGQRPGQQLPTGAEEAKESEADRPDQPERHSESSFPQENGETLGTP